MNTYGPKTEFAQHVHEMKYRDPGETFEDAMNRIASVLKTGDIHYHRIREMLLEQRFLPAGRIQSAIGSVKQVTAYNCFVSGTIDDSLVRGDNSIFKMLTQAAATLQLGGGIGYDFSTLRYRGAPIPALNSSATGPVSFMKVYNEGCKTIASTNHRRGAQMGVMRVDHPDIVEFINAKHNLTELTAFNVSVGVTDQFMDAVMSNEKFNLTWRGETIRTVKATDLWERIMRSTYDWAEPGVLFLDTINRMNNLGYCETIAATNPCGEQPLPPYGACLLGSINLVKYLIETPDGYAFDVEQFEEDMFDIVPMMDTIIDVTTYPLRQQQHEAHSKRRMGIGVTGLANCIEALGYSYGSIEAVRWTNKHLQIMNNCLYRASIELSKERGAFPLLKKDLYLNNGFVSTMPDDIKDDIASYGIRNSLLSSIAPTGTISIAADNISSGIEPVFAFKQRRTIQEFDGPREVIIEDYGLKFLNTRGKKSAKCTVDDHLNMLIAGANNVDSAVSKTCNVPHDVEWSDFQNIYLKAWQNNVKGVTTYRQRASKDAVLVDLDDLEQEDGVACYYDPATGTRTCDE